VMAQKIDAAADYGVNAFIFDWYYYDDGPYLQRALDRGFLQATNNSRIKFGLMWANHDWFDIQARMTKTARYAKAIESLPEQESARQKAPLRRAVQLMKRHRDWTFRDDPDAPRSIVLTTLAGYHYGGEELVTDALLGILDGVITQVESTYGTIEVPNPANHPEKFCEAWAANPKAYGKFVDYLYNFRSQVRDLLPKHGVPTIVEGLNQLFGESLTKRAVASFTEKFERNRQAGLVGFSKNNVGLAVTPASAALVARFVPRNTFHGD
ncbi:MAG: glycoside hydrolase family 99-like domain-containing protein, partial [Isosphaeraceae bacterium]